MAQGKAKKVEEVKVKVKKASSVKFRTAKDARPFLSAPGVRPLNELSENQLIAEGYRQPYVTKTNFAKTKEEREELALKKFKKKDDSIWTPHRKTVSTAKRLTIHIKNKSKEVGFKNTYSEMLRDDEIHGYLDMININPSDVIKMTYGNAPYKVWQNV